MADVRDLRLLGALTAASMFALAAPAARAQSGSTPAPPLALVAPPPTPAFLPPPHDPPEFTAPSVDLERRAHQKKLTGATLMSVGSLVAASGLAVLLDGALDGNDPRLCA